MLFHRTPVPWKRSSSIPPKQRSARSTVRRLLRGLTPGLAPHRPPAVVSQTTPRISLIRRAANMLDPQPRGSYSPVVIRRPPAVFVSTNLLFEPVHSASLSL